MIIRGYRDRPMMFAPDPGEILYARRSPEDKWTRAVVEKAWCNRAGFIRVRVVWLDDDPNASRGERDRNDRDGIGAKQDTSQWGQKVQVGKIGWITMREPLGVSPLIKQEDANRLPRKVIKGDPVNDLD